jgi:hypothetical protein
MVMEAIDMIREANSSGSPGRRRTREVDYSFGPPMFAGPLVNNDVITSVVILKAPLPLDGRHRDARQLCHQERSTLDQEFFRPWHEERPVLNLFLIIQLMMMMKREKENLTAGR